MAEPVVIGNKINRAERVYVFSTSWALIGSVVPDNYGNWSINLGFSPSVLEFYIIAVAPVAGCRPIIRHVNIA